jgi:hypothetical protein
MTSATFGLQLLPHVRRSTHKASRLVATSPQAKQILFKVCVCPNLFNLFLTVRVPSQAHDRGQQQQMMQT